MSALVLALLVAAAAVAWALALGWRTVAPWPHLRPVAWLASLGAVGDVARWALERYALRGEPKPYASLVRLAYHAEQALVMAWPAALVAVALVAFLRRRAWLAALPWALTVAAVAYAYPWLRLERLGYAYAAWSWLCCGVVAGMAWTTYHRTDWGPHHVATLLLVAGEAIAAFAYLDQAALQRWDGPRAAHGMALALLVAYLGRQVWRYRRR
ncbi:hypothetical protein WMF38_57200 [Sorangium sp. So ce118]